MICFIMKDLFSYFFDGFDWKTSFISALIGAIVTIVVSTILSWLKPKKKRYHISVVLGNENVYSGVKAEDIEIDVKYKGVVYDGSLTVLTIELVNDGRETISYDNHFERPIRIRSDSFRILEACSLSNQAIKAVVETNDDGIVCVSWNLLRRKEKIVIRLVAQEIDEKNKNKYKVRSLYDSLKFSVRSDCVDYIKPDSPETRNLMILSIILFVAVAITHVAFSEEQPRQIIDFRVQDTVLSGNLMFDQIDSVYTLVSPDSIKTSSGLLDFQKYPIVSVSFGRNHRAYLVVSYGIGILIIVFFYIIFKMTNKIGENKKTFDDF